VKPVVSLLGFVVGLAEQQLLQLCKIVTVLFLLLQSQKRDIMKKKIQGK
jgi:hypothetical protein